LRKYSLFFSFNFIQKKKIAFILNKWANIFWYWYIFERMYMLLLSNENYRSKCCLIIEFTSPVVAWILAGIRCEWPVIDTALHQRGWRECSRGGRNFPFIATEQITASYIFESATCQVQVSPLPIFTLKKAFSKSYI